MRLKLVIYNNLNFKKMEKDSTPEEMKRFLESIVKHAENKDNHQKHEVTVTVQHLGDNLPGSLCKGPCTFVRIHGDIICNCPSMS